MVCTIVRRTYRQETNIPPPRGAPQTGARTSELCHTPSLSTPYSELCHATPRSARTELRHTQH
jgi:hypothetical protein